MKIQFDKYPIDIFLCILCSVTLVPLALFNLGGILTIILGLPFIFFIPGYLLIFSIIPTKKTYKGIDFIERIALSIGFSIAIVSILGVGLNFLLGGIQLKSALISIFIFIICLGAIAVYRWLNTQPDQRLNISFDLNILKSEDKPEKILTVILITTMILTLVIFVYVIVSPKNLEKFTEFYILSSSGKTGGYLENFNLGENLSVIIGIKNHEYKTTSYFIEIWLINETIIYNETTNESDTIYYNAWFIDKINVTLGYISVDPSQSWKPQWEYNYTINLNKKGEEFKIIFLLFKTQTENYIVNEDYKDIIGQKINSAYGENHLWVDIK